MEPLLENSKTEKKGFFDNISERIKSRGTVFWVAVVVLVLVVIGVIIAVVCVVNKKKNKEVETYSASDDVSSEFDYVNSYIYSTIGETEDNLV